MKALFILAVLSVGLSAWGLEYRTVDVVHVYGTGWNADGGWLVPMTETAADAVIKLQDIKKNHVKCSVKGVLKGATLDPNTLEFLAYDIKDCQ